MNGLDFGDHDCETMYQCLGSNGSTTGLTLNSRPATNSGHEANLQIEGNLATVAEHKLLKEL